MNANTNIDPLATLDAMRAIAAALRPYPPEEKKKILLAVYVALGLADPDQPKEPANGR